MFLVIGITGRVGGSVADHLLEQGLQVRALVRDPIKAESWAKRGVELVEGDLSDPASITAALDDVEGAYVMIPPYFMPSPDFGEAKILIEGCGQALRSAHLPRLVILSSIGAEKTSGLGAITPLSLLEAELRGLPYPHAFIRPGAFYENYLYALQVGRTGTLPLFFSDLDALHAMTAIMDIGAEVARLLTCPAWAGDRVIELGSMVSANEIVAQLGKVLDLTIEARIVPRDQWASALEQSGFPKGQTWAFEDIYDGVNSRWIDFGVEDSEHIEGTTTARDVFAAALAASS